MNFIGDFKEDSTVEIFFSTNDGNGGRVAPSDAFENTDIKIYKNGSSTEKTTQNGITMTSPFDSLVGIHSISIDTSVDTGDTGFWATGNDYTVILYPDETVDGQSVSKVLAQFSIENRLTADISTQIGVAGAGLTDLGGMSTGMKAEVEAEATDALTAYDPPTRAEATADKNEILTDTGNIETDTQDIQTQLGTAGAGLTDLGGMSTAMKAEVQAEATAALNAYDPPTKAEMDSGHSTINSNIDANETKIDSLQATANAIETDTQDLQTKVGVPATLGDGATLADMLTAMAGKTASAGSYDRTADSQEAIRDRGDAAWAGSGSALTQQEVRDAMKLAPTGGAPAAGSVDEALDNIETDTQDIQTQIGTAGAGLTDLGGMSTAMKAEVEAEATDALNAYDPPTRDEATADKEEILVDTGNIETDTQDIQSNLGTPPDLGSGATLANNLTDIAGAGFDSGDNLVAIKALLETDDGKLDAIVAKLPASGAISNLQIDTTFDGVRLDRSFENINAMFNGKFSKDVPTDGQITFYKRDNATPLSIVSVSDTERNRIL